MNFQLLLKDLEEVKSVIYEDTERAEELLDHVISEIAIKAAQQSVHPTRGSVAQKGKSKSKGSAKSPRR